MVDIALYRSRIGTFCRHRSDKTLKFRKYQCSTKSENEKKGKIARDAIKVLVKIFLIYCFLNPTWYTGTVNNVLSITSTPTSWRIPAMASSSWAVGHEGFSPLDWTQLSQKYRVRGKKQKINFLAKYLNGNRRNGIRNLHLNIRTVKNKILEVKNIIKNQDPHIFGLSECELKKKNNRFDEEILKIPGYRILFPKTWASLGQARTIMYVKKTFEFEQINDLENEDVQSIWIRGGFKNGKKIYFSHGYREHSPLSGISQQENLELFLKQWEAATAHNNPSEPNEVHISGDMNLDMLDSRWLRNDYPQLNLSRMVDSCCQVNNFSQLVKDVTRVQYNSVNQTTNVSCIDHIYTNVKYRCSEATVTPFGSSDHDLIGYTRYSKEPPAPAKTIMKRSYSNFDPTKFLEDLSQVSWADVLSCPDLDIATDIFTHKFKSVLDLHAPWIKYQKRKSFCPWLTQETKQMMIQRDKLKQKAKGLAMRDIRNNIISNDQIEAWAQFKDKRNKINNAKKNEEHNFKKNKVTKSLGNSEATWSTVKSFMNWKSSGTPDQLEVNNKLVTNAAGIANIMGEYFINKVKTIRDKMVAVPENLDECSKIMRNKNCSLSLQHTSVKTVEKLLQSLKTSKSTSVDELDSFSVKLSANIIAAPVHHIVTLSIMQMRFPTRWKYTKLIPLHKKQSKLDPKNYRPVAILSPLSKILEKIIFTQIYNYFTNHRLFHPSLPGYRQHRSTHTALLQLYDQWVRSAGKGCVSGVVLLDLSAAFDLVDPDIMIKKLRIYGLDKEFCSWIFSYLQDRHQAVWIDHVFSEFVHNSIGVPQGSNLGPLFFLIYFNDLLSTLDCPVEVYADDSTMTETGARIPEIETRLTENCRKVSRWMVENRFKLNANKTHFLLVGTQERLRITEQPAITMDGILLKENNEKCELLLGVKIQSNLKWNKQIAWLVGKLKTRVIGLHKLKFLVPYQTRNTIVTGIFNSVLIYCLPLYGGITKGQVKELQVLQNKAGQIVCHKPPFTNRKELYDQLGWMTVSQLIVYHTILMVFKIRKSGEPEYLAGFLKMEGRHGKIIIPRTKLSLAKNSFCYRGSENWNCLPEALRTCQQISTFKLGLRKWVLQNISRFQD